MRTRLSAVAAVVLTVAAMSALAGSAAAFPPGEGPGGPILVISDPGDPFGRYYAEILTAEGLNAFEVRDVDQISPATLSGHGVVILARTTLTAIAGRRRCRAGCRAGAT